MLVAGAALLLIASGPSAGGICANYVGRRVAVTAFDEIRSGLPAIVDRSPYESTADYRRRLAEAPPGAQEPLVIRHIARQQGEGLSYDPDRQILRVFASAFGLGEINFSNIPSLRPDDARADNFTDAIGFVVSAKDTGQDTYEATNAFGASVTVTRTKRRVDAIWEAPGRLGQSQFVGGKAFRPVAELRLSPDAAREIVEGGSTAILFVPRAPFQASGTSILEASLSRPKERVDTINVIIADVRCAFMLDRSGSVLRAFEVR
jgi:hypothetical protein